MFKLLLPLLLTAAANAQTVPVGQMLTKGNVSVVVMQCCASSQLTLVPQGFILHVTTKDADVDEFRATVTYRTKDGVQRRDKHVFQRWPDEWTSEFFSIGDAELLAVVVTEGKPGESATFTAN